MAADTVPHQSGGEPVASGRNPSPRRRPWILYAVIAGVVVVVLAAGAIVWFEPQKLFLDETVDEAAPVATQPAATAPTPSGPVVTAPPAPVVVSTGAFSAVEHDGTGTALLIRNPDGSALVRFEELDVSNGPDLVVILSRAPVGSSAGAYDDGEYVTLGELKANKGNQNYEIPATVDVAQYPTVAIWCRRFNSTFNVAPITG